MHRTLALIFCLICACQASSSLSLAKNVYDRCSSQQEPWKCFKVQGLRLLDRALQSKKLNLFEGVSLVSDTRQARSILPAEPENLTSDAVDNMLVDNAANFLNTRKIIVDFPKLAEEGRRRKGNNRINSAALLWALAIKGSFLAMAYKGIGIMAGTALIVGKMALLLSAILGLKKLVSGNHDHTTFEIVKHPKHSESYSHSSSVEEDGHYRRSGDIGQHLAYRSITKM